jgi:hypothetical protein
MRLVLSLTQTEINGTIKTSIGTGIDDLSIQAWEIKSVTFYNTTAIGWLTSVADYRFSISDGTEIALPGEPNLVCQQDMTLINPGAPS